MSAQVLESLRRKRVGHEGHHVYTAVERYELDPFPHRDVQMGRDNMLQVSASGQLNHLGSSDDLGVGARIGFLNRFGNRLRLDPTTHDRKKGDGSGPSNPRTSAPQEAQNCQRASIASPHSRHGDGRRSLPQNGQKWMESRSGRASRHQ